MRDGPHGIVNGSSSLTVNNCVVTHCFASGAAAYLGGGISNSGTMTIARYSC